MTYFTTVKISVPCSSEAEDLMFDEIFGSEDFGNEAVDGAAVGPVTQVHMDKDFARQNIPCCLPDPEWWDNDIFARWEFLPLTM